MGWLKPPRIIEDAKNGFAATALCSTFLYGCHLSLFTSNLFCLSFFLSHSCSLSVHFRSILPLLYFPLSVSRLPHLFSLLPMLPLLSPMSTAAENPAQTPACVFVRIRRICRQSSYGLGQIKNFFFKTLNGGQML